MFTLTLLAAAVASPSPILRLKADYETCVRTETVRLGAGNDEPADTILRAVRSVCQPQWVAFGLADPMIGIARFDGATRRLHDAVRANAENDAIAALLDARAKRP